LKYLSKSQLRILRNAFYAFYGYDFRDENLKSFFLNFKYSSKNPSWYIINKDFNENMFTKIERNNINNSPYANT